MQKKILVIDDEEILTKTFSLFLERSGFQVYTAKNGFDAQAMVASEDFDLILCDIRMPGMNGVEIIKSILKPDVTAHSKNTPIIFITGFADDSAESQARKLNPIAYVYKPFDNNELLETIKKALV